MKAVYHMADHSFELVSVYSAVQKLCSIYRSEGAPEFSIRTDQADIEYERKKSAAERRAEGFPVRYFSDGYLESLAVYRKLVDRLLEDNILLFHGSAIAVDGIGYLFAAKSGTGKSTHTRLWREMLGSRAVMINDDKPLLKVTDIGVMVYGTPWDGKHRLSSNSSAPLRAICMLERGENNGIRLISAQEAWPMLLMYSNRPAEPDKLEKTLKLVDNLMHSVRLYRLHCNMNQEAAQVAFEKMSEGASI